MTIGIPRAFYYYKYGVLWQTFFSELGCRVVVSDHTNEETYQNGARHSIGECCLPAKVFMGHVAALVGKCDYILAPFVQRGKGGHAYCTRFWGIYDVLRHTHRGEQLLQLPLESKSAFHKIAKQLGKGSLAYKAYQSADSEQKSYDSKCQTSHSQKLGCTQPKVLLAGRPYVMHDPYIGGAVARILSALGCTVLYSNQFAGAAEYAADVCHGLYWSETKNAIGATVANSSNISGAIFLTVFPCAPDALAWEMATRNIKNLPITTLLLDGLHGDAGLETRLESFVDML